MPGALAYSRTKGQIEIFYDRVQARVGPRSESHLLAYALAYVLAHEIAHILEGVAHHGGHHES
jgi:predicted metalloprotease